GEAGMASRRHRGAMPRPARPDARRRQAAPKRPWKRGEPTHAERLAGSDGYFAPDSVIRRLGNTPLTPMLGGGTAVLPQVAPPLVRGGVAQHSDSPRNLWSRLARTLRALYLIAFGTRAEADRAGAAVQAVQAHVR